MAIFIIKNSLVSSVLCLCIGLVSTSPEFFKTNVKPSEVLDIIKGDRDLNIKAGSNGIEVSAGLSETEIALLIGGIAVICLLFCICFACCISACCCRRRRDTTIIYSQMPSSAV